MVRLALASLIIEGRTNALEAQEAFVDYATSSVVGLFADRHFTARQANLGECFRVDAKRLIHVGHHLNHLADKIAVFVLDNFGHETRTDRLTIVVELHLAIGRVELKRG